MRTWLWAFALAGLAGVVGCARKEQTATKEPEARPQGKPEAKADGVGPTLTLDLGDGVTLELVQIPAGKFLMGSPDSEKDRDEDESPQHEVTISKAFYLGKYEVTQEQYEKVMGSNPSQFKGLKNPVETILWNDAQEFCKKASQLTGKTVRLPTEAEWEDACRAGTKTRFHPGDGDPDLEGVAWYTGNANRTTHAVGQRKPNAWGLYDLHGNVWEWCQDWFAEKYDAGMLMDPQGPANGNDRVIRGGHWGSQPRYCRSASRRGQYPGNCGDDVGFRVVVVAPRAP